MKSHPRSAPEIEAAYCYPALPEEVRKAVSLDDFAKRLEELLVENGDLDRNSRLATSQGQSRGFHNSKACNWDDNVKHVTYTTEVVRADKRAQEYIKTVVASCYPGFDEEKYSQIKEGRGDQVRHHTFLSSKSLYLSRRAYNLAEDLIEGRLREWFDDLVYICLDEQDIGPFLRVFKDKSYDHDKESKRESPVVMSGEQVNLTLKEEKTTGNSIYIRYNQDTVIFHFEDITGLAAQRVLADKLWSMKHSNTDLWSTINTARLILISTLMPYEYCIANEKLRKIILSAPTYDLRTSIPAQGEVHCVTLRGRIANQPHYRHSPSDTAVLEFALVVDSVQLSNKDAHSFDCVVYYNMANFVFCNFQEGDDVVVLGKLHNRRWTDEEGKTFSKVEIVCDNVYAAPFEEPQKDENEDEEE